MSMTNKELKIKYPDKEFGEINIKRNYENPITGEKDQWGNDKIDYSNDAQVIDRGWEFYLNHSCDEWLIGDLKDAEEFNRDLVEAIEFTRNNP